MALVSNNIPNLINGVSQQPAALRLASQGEAQENGFSDVVDGLKKRPPTEFKKALVGGAHVNDKLFPHVLRRSFFHTYKRSDSEQFTVIYDPETVKMRVYDIEGNLRYESGTASWDAFGNLISTNNDNLNYLMKVYGGGHVPITKDDIKATSVADYTFFVNKTRAVLKSYAPSHSRLFEGMFYLKKTDYAKSYTFQVDNNTIGYWETHDGATAYQAHTLDTSNIMNYVCGRSNSNTHALNSQQMDLGNCLLTGGWRQPYFTLSRTSDFTLTCTDGTGGTSLFAHKDSIANFTSLPKYCTSGFVIQVNGDNQKKEDDFYVKFDGDESTGTWKECPAPSRPNAPVYHDLSASTMPHTLRQNADESFTFGVAQDADGNSWASRVAGDDATNPFPSFVGTVANPSYITDVFFHRNRLGFLSGENVIFSEASNYFNFFRVTVRSLLDSDPIDVAVSQNEVSDLQAAVPTQDNLMLFSGLTQFSLSADQLLTPSEVTIDQSTKYECDLTARPVSVGTSIYFTHKDGNFSGVRELFTQGDSDTQDAPSVTSHVPEYITGGVRQLIGSSNEDMLMCLTDDNLKECYVYKWYESDRERLQSSWSKWVFDEDIEHITFNNNKVYFIFNDASFEVMSLSNIRTNESNECLLDHRTKVETYSTFSAMYPRQINDDTVIITDTGLVIELTAEGLTFLQSYLAEQGNSVYFGQRYTFKYQFSEQIFKPKDDPTRIARYQLRNISLNYNDTGSFKVVVTRTGRVDGNGDLEQDVTNFTGRILSESSNLLGASPEVEEGTLKVGLQSQAKETTITIINDSHLPSTFQNAEVEAYVTLRNQRI